jgi:predicted transcriptional regulator
MTKITVYLPRELKRALTRLARQRGCSEAELLREAVARITRDDEGTYRT